MKKLFNGLALLCLLLYSNGIVSQSVSNQEKYWGYRDKLRKNFVRIGIGQGHSIPMASRSIGMAYAGAEEIDGLAPSRIYYQDATILLGQYLTVLATEYRQTEGDEEATLAVLHELYYALEAINRIDKSAEQYFTGIATTPEDLDGFFLRDDVPFDFHVNNYQDDESLIFDRPANIIKTHSDYNPLVVYEDEGVPGTQNMFNSRNKMSIDQLGSLLLGLRCIYDIVGDFEVQPTDQDPIVNIREESKAIANRIINHLIDFGDEKFVSGALRKEIKSNIQQPNGYVLEVHGGYMGFYLPFIIQLGVHFQNTDCEQIISEGPSNYYIDFNMDTGLQTIENDEDGLINADWYPCRNLVNNHIEENELGIISVARIPLSSIYVFLETLENDEFLLTNSGEPINRCVTINNAFSEAIEAIDIGIEGVLCDDIALSIIPIILKTLKMQILIATTISTFIEETGMTAGLDNLLHENYPNINIHGINEKVMQMGQLLSFFLFSYSYKWHYDVLTDVIGVFAGQQAGISVCTNDLQQLDLAENSDIYGDFEQTIADGLNDDVVHMFLEFSIMSNFWGHEYINTCSVASNMHHYSMLDKVLNGGNSFWDDDVLVHVNDLLNAAPCEGPFENPNAPLGTTGYNEWRSYNRIFHPSNRNSGTPATSFRGEYAGLDYMYYYNLNAILLEQNNPRVRTCQCVESVFPGDYSNEPILVKRKFEDYKAKGIPIESYLNTSLQMDGANANLIVKNDLIVCRDNTDLETIVTFEGGATLELYEGNTITVEPYNTLEFNSSSSLIAGLTYDNCCNGHATIILKEGARLIFNNGSSLNILAEIDIVGGEQSLIQFDNSILNLEEMVSMLNIQMSGSASIKFENSSDVDANSFSTFNLTLDNAAFTGDNSDLHFHYLNIDASNQSIVTFDNNASVFGINGQINLWSHSYIEDMDGSKIELWGGNILLRDGSEFNLQEATLDLRKDASIHLTRLSNLEAWPTFYHNGGTIILDGHESTFAIEGAKVEVADGVIFTFDHPELESGYVLIGGLMDHEFDLGINSEIRLYGDNENDCILKIMDYANLWLEDNSGHFSVTDGLVNMNNNGQIWLGPNSEFFNVRFVDWDENNGYASIQSYYSEMSVVQSRFEGVHIETYHAPLSVGNCEFTDSKCGIQVSGGSFDIRGSEFTACGIVSDRLDRVSYLRQSILNSGTHPSVLFGLDDNSIVDVICQSNVFNQYQGGVRKTDGRLFLKCNSFNNHRTAVNINRAYLSMSSKEGNGFNEFWNNQKNIGLLNATGISLYAGQNDFTGYTASNISGTIQWNCYAYEIDCYGPSIDASFNKWPTAPLNPTSFPEPNNPAGQAYDCFVTTTSTVGGTCPQGSSCGIFVDSSNPITSIYCQDTKPVIKIDVVKNVHASNENTNMIHSRNDDFNSVGGSMQLRDFEVDNSNPIISTTSFMDVPMDSALTYAASFLEQYDSLGNNTTAVLLFNEILTSDLDRSNESVRSMMTWGVNFMKSAIEDMFTSGQLSADANQAQFEAPVGQYVEVLNLMTDTILSSETYKEQFYVELNKGQLFKTINKPMIAGSIFGHLDDCELDSLEQVVLDFWRAQITNELLSEELFAQGLPFDSIGTSETEIPAFEATEYLTSDYYFGVWIISPSSLSFVNCGSNAVYRNLYLTNISAELYPNPTSEVLNVRITDGEEVFDKLTIFNAAGQIVLATRVQLSNGDVYSLQLPSEISTGTYILRLSNDHFVSDMTFQKY